MILKAYLNIHIELNAIFLFVLLKILSQVYYLAHNLQRCKSRFSRKFGRFLIFLSYVFDLSESRNRRLEIRVWEGLTPELLQSSCIYSVHSISFLRALIIHITRTSS